MPEAVAFGEYWLEIGPDLPIVELLDSKDRYCGLLLGFVLDPGAGQVPDGHWQADCLVDATDPQAFADHVLHALAGRFLLLLDTGQLQRIYPDCGARITCVYDRETGHVGSTAHALLGDVEYEERFLSRLYERLKVDGEGWFPAGLTAHRNVERLLPGFYLDLQQGQRIRFWPLAQPQAAHDPGRLVDEIIINIQAQIETIINSGKRPAIALTAGHDTRVVLACARKFLSSIDVVTVVGDGRHSLDTIVARRIARRFGLNHIELPLVDATDEQQRNFIRRGGHCNADTNSRTHPSIWPLQKNHVMVGGNDAEYARGYLWKSGDSAATRVTPEMLAARFGLYPADEILVAFQSWLDSIPSMDAFTILDLAYRENRTGPWSSVQFCCDPTVVRHAPMLSWPVIERMASLPVEWRRDSRLGHEIIAKCWPELGTIPYNSLGPWRDFLFRLQRVLADPGVILKKWRKLRG